MQAEPSCKNCKPPVRYSGCHSECEKYKQWKEEYERKKNAFKKARDEELNYHIYKAGQVEKTKRRTNK